MTDVSEYLAARDFLLETRTDYDRACAGFRWPRPQYFNWAADFFDVAWAGSERTALWVIDADGTEHRFSFAEMIRRSNAAANYLRSLGVQRGDTVLIMLDNEPALWDAMLALIKLGARIIPASTLLSPADVTDRVRRGEVTHVIAVSTVADRFAAVDPRVVRIACGEPVPGWQDFAQCYGFPGEFTPDGPTPADDVLFMYFTSGTTNEPKLVAHTHASYPIGHLSTMYWIGIEPGEVHLNISSPGWGKHAWSNLFAPWIAGATVLVYNYERFDADKMLEVLERCRVGSFCAPPTVWRMLIQADLTRITPALREVVSAGEPLNPEVIGAVRDAWGLTIRDGFGQTETTAQIGNTPGQPVKAGSMGRPLPGYRVQILGVDGAESGEGELCLDLTERPVGLTPGYADDPALTARAMRGGVYHTGDVVSVDSDGYITYVGRDDDVFKASDYRLSPFELESALVEHPAVQEAAVVPGPDAVRLAVPKAYVVLAPGCRPDLETARSILMFARENLAPFKRIRRLQFAELPKTISGKIRRAELREWEKAPRDARGRLPGEYWDVDFRHA